MSQYDSKVQNLFLSQLRKKHQKVEIVLETGNVLRGKLKAYDQFSVTLSFKDQVEIVYKSSIIYITAIPSLPEKKPFRSNQRGSYSRPNYRDDYGENRERPYRDRAYNDEGKEYSPRPYRQFTPPGYGDDDRDTLENNSYYRRPYRRSDDAPERNDRPAYNRQPYDRSNYERPSYDRPRRDYRNPQDDEDKPYRPPRRPSSY